MKTPIISVISPIYNGQKYINNLISSLENQTFKDFEFILIDDGSKDDTVKIAKKILNKTNINYKILKQENGGQSKARNYGLENAQGKWVVTIDSDDTIQSNYLNNLYEAVKNENCDVAFCDIQYVKENNVFFETNEEFNYQVLDGKDCFSKFIMHEVAIGPCTLIINKKHLEKLKLFYNENSRYSEEFIFICSLLYNSDKVAHVNQKLYNYCLRSGSVSTGASIEKVVNGFNEILKSNKNYNDKNCKYCEIYQKYAMGRWIIGTARFNSKNMDYKNYKKLLKTLQYKKYLKDMNTFPSFKIRCVNFLLKRSIFITYWLLRWWG